MNCGGDATRRMTIRSTRVVTPAGLQAADVIVQGETIVDVVPRQAAGVGGEVSDVGDLVVSPGLVDAHVHVNEPGRTEWEGFATATRAALAGGVTTLVDMPLNSAPVTTTVTALAEKRNAAAGQCWCDVGFYGGLIPDNARQIVPLIEAGVLGIKAFLCPSGLPAFPAVQQSDLHQAVPAIAAGRLPLLVHCELPAAVSGPGSAPSLPGREAGSSEVHALRSYSRYCASRPAQWEVDAIKMMIGFCRQHRGPIHIVHLSAADALTLIDEAKSAGLPLTVETCPHYLFFSAERIPDGDTRFKCAPPIRGDENRDALWAGLLAGTIDTIGSDHSPCLPPMKHLETGDFDAAWGGIASLQWLLPAVWTAAGERDVRLSDLSRWMSREPARMLRIQDKKGSIESGLDADLVVWDPQRQFRVEESTIQHRHPVTPYRGSTLRGKVQQTYLRGRLAYDDGSFIEPAPGRLLTRPDA